MVDDLSDLAPLGDDLLLLVMGPGLGESVIVRWPPDNWLVIDSFRRSSRGVEVHPAVAALQMFDGYADAVALTHPHDDHTGGFASLIERRKPNGRVGWWPFAPGGDRWWTESGSHANRLGSNEQALAAIERAWREEPTCRWELDPAQQPLEVAGATVEVLTPLAETVSHLRSLRRPDVNELSSAMLFKWADCQLLLGGDLVNLRGWDSLWQIHGDYAFAGTHAMKVAHHGSSEAQHPVALGSPPPTSRTFLATPYNRGHKVPDYRDGKDVEQLLQVMDRLFISAHHGSLPNQRVRGM